MDADLDRQLDTLRLGAIGGLIIVALSQLAPLYLGWEMLTGRRDPQPVAVPVTVVDAPPTASLADKPGPPVLLPPPPTVLLPAEERAPTQPRAPVHPHPCRPPVMAGAPPLDPAPAAGGGGAPARDRLPPTEKRADRWGTNPPRVLRTGGVGVRDLAALAAGLDVSADEVNFLVELSRTAGLLGRDGSPDGIRPEAWVPPADYDTWAARAAALSLIHI